MNRSLCQLQAQARARTKSQSQHWSVCPLISRLEKRKTLMFKRIVVAYNESPEAGRALASAIRLAKLVEAELQVVTVVKELPAYTAYATAADSSLTRTLREDRSQRYEQMQAEVRETALREGVAAVT